MSEKEGESPLSVEEVLAHPDFDAVTEEYGPPEGVKGLWRRNPSDTPSENLHRFRLTQNSGADRETLGIYWRVYAKSARPAAQHLGTTVVTLARAIEHAQDEALSKQDELQ